MPQTFTEWCKEILWIILMPFWPPVRWCMRLVGIHPFGKDRQPTLLGWLSTDKTPEQFRQFLKSIGFRHNPLSWVDDGELFGLRNRLTFKHQQHVRLYKDREVRAHQEITPEFNDIKHIRGLGTNVGDIFLLLDDWLTKTPPSKE